MTFQELPEAQQQLLGFLFDPSIPTSLAFLLPPKIGSHLLREIAKDEKLAPLLTNEEDLRSYISEAHRYKTPGTDERMRMTFWLEYERAILTNEKMVVYNIHSLVCDERVFYRVFCTNPGRAAFLVCRPTAYQEQVKEILNHGLRGMRRVLDMPEYDKNGKLNLKLIELKTKITAMMDMRLHGAPTQKVQQLNVNVDASGRKDISADTKKMIAKGDIQTIQRRLLEIESEMGKGSTAVPEEKPEPLTIDAVVVERK